MEFRAPLDYPLGRVKLLSTNGVTGVPHIDSAGARGSLAAGFCTLAALLGGLLEPVCARAQTVAPAVQSVAFSPSIVASGGTSQLTITLANPNSSSATLTQAFSDPLPAGLQVAGAASGSCALGSVIASAGARSVGYARGATIPAGGCTISVPVKAPSVLTTSYYTDALPGAALQTNFGAGSSAVSATLTVQDSPLTSVPAQLNGSQRSVGKAIGNLCAALQSTENLTLAQKNLLATCSALISTYGNGANAAGLPGTLTALSGRQVVAQQITAVQFSGEQFTNIGQRLEQLRAGAGGVNLGGLETGLSSVAGLPELLDALKHLLGLQGLRISDGLPGGASGDDEGHGSVASRLGLFVNGTLRTGTQDTTLQVTGFDFRSNGITAGVDYRLTNDAIIGGAYGHTSGSTDFVGGNGTVQSDSNTGSVYGTYYRGPFYVDVIATYGHNVYQETRTSTFSIDSSGSQPAGCAAGDCTIDTSGNTGAGQTAAASNVGYTMHHGALQFGPEGSLDYTRVRVNAFTEDDPTQSGLALAYGDEVGNSLLLKVGALGSYAIDTPIGVILPEVRAHYIHEFLNEQRTYTVHFADDPEVGTPSGPVSNFVVYTDQPIRDYLDWAAGISAQFPFGISGFVEYGAVAQETYIHTNEWSAGLRFQRPFD